MRALIIDDNATDSDTIARSLEAAGYPAVAVASTHAARQIFAERSFDLLLLALEAPPGDGLRLCARIRDQRGDAITIILLTVQDMPLLRVTGLQLGADDVVRKPFNVEELMARIAVLRRQRK